MRTAIFRIAPTLILVLSLPLLDASASSLAPIGYSTTGTIGTSGITGTNVVRFEGVDTGQITGGTSSGGVIAIPDTGYTFDLGRFQIQALPEGQTTTYQNTPFAVTIAINGTTPILFDGRLEGSVTGSDASRLWAILDMSQFTDVTLFDTLHTINTVSVGGASGELEVFQGGFPVFRYGSLTIAGDLHAVIQPVPEPSSVVVFLGAATWLASRKRRRVRTTNSRVG